MVSFTFRNVPAAAGTVKIQVLSMDGTAVVIEHWTMHLHHIGAYG